MQSGIGGASGLALHRRIADPPERKVDALRVGALLERAATVGAQTRVALVAGDPQVALGLRETVKLGQRQAKVPSEAQVSLDLGVPSENRADFGSVTPRLLRT